MKRSIACGVFTLPGRHTDFALVTSLFTKPSSQNWIDPVRAICHSHDRIGTPKIASR